MLALEIGRTLASQTVAIWGTRRSILTWIVVLTGICQNYKNCCINPGPH